MNYSLTQLAQHNFFALCSVARFLDSRGYWTTSRDIALDVAEAVHSLFESLAWADKSLHERECWLAEALFDEGEPFSEQLKEVFADGTTNNKKTVPGCLAAAALHDSIHGTFFAGLFLNHLENLGRLIMMADATVSDEETRAYQAYFSQLRGRVAVPPELESHKA